MNVLQNIEIGSVVNKRIWGRTIQSATSIPLLWTGSSIELVAKSSELWFELEVDFDVYEPWFAIVINGEVISRLMLPKGRHLVCAFRNLKRNTAKHVQLVKEVQAMSADDKHILLVHYIRHDGELLEVPEYSKKIEFIGDSITSGEGAIGAKQEEDWTSIWFSAVNNYTRYTANMFNAEYRVISQSGWGVYCSWDENRDYNIPSYYEQICGLMHGERHIQLGLKEEYDFRRWQPNYIVINLGTNDGSAYRSLLQREGGNNRVVGKFLEQYEKAIIAFLHKVRQHNTMSTIIWAYGMLGYELIEYIEQAIMQYKQSYDDEQVYLCKLPSMDETTVGSRYHPGEKLHIKTAKALYSFISDLEKQ